MTTYTQSHVQPGDYAKLTLCDEYHRVTAVHENYVDLIDSNGLHTDADYGDIEELALRGEYPGTNF